MIRDKEVTPPFLCENCKHYLGGLSCRAFDVIPLNIYGEVDKHREVVEGQKGDYVFEPGTPPEPMRVYYDDEDGEPDAPDEGNFSE